VTLFVLGTFAFGVVGFALALRRANRAFGIPGAAWAKPGRWLRNEAGGGGIAILGEPETAEQGRAQVSARIWLVALFASVLLAGLGMRDREAWSAFGSAQDAAGLLLAAGIGCAFAFAARLGSDRRASVPLLLGALGCGIAVALLAAVA